MKTANSTAITVTGLLGKPIVTNCLTAMGEVIVYNTDGKTTYKIRGSGLGLLPQYLPVTFIGVVDEKGIIQVRNLRRKSSLAGDSGLV